MASRRARAALVAGAAMSLVAFTATYLTHPWEGQENRAYWDAMGRVWTICNGETKDVTPGMVMTDQQCSADLYRRLEADYHRPLQACIGNFDQAPKGVQAAFLDLSWNIGVGATCHSTAAGLYRTGDYRAACNAIVVWDRAGGHVVTGLKHRRSYGDAQRIGEQELCLASVAEGR